jgi:hypothetical protein
MQLTGRNFFSSIIQLLLIENWHLEKVVRIMTWEMRRKEGSDGYPLEWWAFEKSRQCTAFLCGMGLSLRGSRSWFDTQIYRHLHRNLAKYVLRNYSTSKNGVESEREEGGGKGVQSGRSMPSLTFLFFPNLSALLTFLLFLLLLPRETNPI